MAGNDVVLVTGGAGYVGSHTIIHLLRNNYTVIAIDCHVNCDAEKNQKPESIKRVETITGQTVLFYTIDIKDRNALEKLFKTHHFDFVIHLAGIKGVGVSVQFPLRYYQNNIAGSSNLFEVMHENNVKKIIFSSSSTVYGTPKFLPITEGHPTGQSCTNPYGRSKYFVEEILKDVCTSDPDWKVIILRYFNIVGAHESGLIGEDPAGIPNNLMSYISQVAIGRRDSLKIFGDDYNTSDGTAVHDYIHITDLSIGHVRALDKIKEPMFSGWTAYNFGTGKGYSVLEMVKTFSQVSGREINYEIVEKRKGDGNIALFYADVTLAKQELNWTPGKDIHDMCRDAWNWQVKNPNGFQKY